MRGSKVVAPGFEPEWMDLRCFGKQAPNPSPTRPTPLDANETVLDVACDTSSLIDERSYFNEGPLDFGPGSELIRCSLPALLVVYKLPAGRRLLSFSKAAAIKAIKRTASKSTPLRFCFLANSGNGDGGGSGSGAAAISDET